MIGVLWVVAVLAGPAAQANRSDEPGTVVMQAFELRMAGQVDEAKRLLETAVDANRADAAVQFELARVRFYTIFTNTDGVNLGPAQKAIEKAIAIDGDNPRYHFWAGKIATYYGIQKMHGVLSRLEMPGQMNKAIKSFERAVALQPDFHEARVDLMGLYDRLPWFAGGNKSKARQQLHKLEQLDPVYGAKARCEIQPRKTSAEKIAIWQKVVDAHPDNAGAHAGLAGAYMQNDGAQAADTQYAVDHLNRAIELDASYCTELLNLARYYAQAREHDKAEKAIRRFVNFDPAPPVALRANGLRQLARIKKAQQKPDEAKALQAEADDRRNGRFTRCPRQTSTRLRSNHYDREGLP